MIKEHNPHATLALNVPQTEHDRQEWRETVDRARTTFWDNHHHLATEPEVREVMTMIGFEEMYQLADLYDGQTRSMQMQRRPGRKSVGV